VDAGRRTLPSGRETTTLHLLGINWVGFTEQNGNWGKTPGKDEPHSNLYH